MVSSTSVYHLVERGQSEPFYTGMSADPKARMSRHVVRSASDYRFDPVNEKIRDVGVENVDMIVIASNLTNEQAKALEGELIATVTHVDLGGTNANHSR